MGQTLGDVSFGVDRPLFVASRSVPSTEKDVLAEFLFSFSIKSWYVLLAEDLVLFMYDGTYSVPSISECASFCNAFFLFFGDFLGDGVLRNTSSSTCTRGVILVESSMSLRYLGV